MHMSSDEKNFIDVIKGLCSPPSLDSFLCTKSGSEIAHFQSYIHKERHGTTVDPTPPDLFNRILSEFQTTIGKQETLRSTLIQRLLSC